MNDTLFSLLLNAVVNFKTIASATQKVIDIQESRNEPTHDMIETMGLVVSQSYNGLNTEMALKASKILVGFIKTKA